MIAALYVQKNGCYFNLVNVDPWDQKRDARLYPGPHSVVAHPPCQLWGKFAKINYHRWGGEHNRPGNDGGCFAAALESVRKNCGVLEHPADTYAWEAHDLPKPAGLGWQWVDIYDPRDNIDHYVCEVWQSAYGHKARKRTWLYYCGYKEPHALKWERKPGTHQIGRDQRDRNPAVNRNKPKLSGKAASATPVEFRDALIKLAANAK
jgi:hypothetical protein